MVGTSADNTNVDAVALVPAGETIDNVDAVAGVEVVYSTLTVDTPHIRRHGLVDRAPPDVVLGAVLLYDTLVGR